MNSANKNVCSPCHAIYPPDNLSYLMCTSVIRGHLNLELINFLSIKATQ